MGRVKGPAGMAVGALALGIVAAILARRINKKLPADLIEQVEEFQRRINDALNNEAQSEAANRFLHILSDRKLPGFHVNSNLNCGMHFSVWDVIYLRLNALVHGQLGENMLTAMEQTFVDVADAADAAGLDLGLHTDDD